MHAVRLYNAGRYHKSLSSVGDASLHAYTAIVTSLFSRQTLYNARRGHNSLNTVGDANLHAYTTIVTFPFSPDVKLYITVQ